MTAKLEARGIRKSFGANEVCRGIDLSVGQGEMVCLIGASGSGKSTLLRCLNLLEPIDDGEIQSARDVDGHGYSDLAVGSPCHDDGVRNGSHEAWPS